MKTYQNTVSLFALSFLLATIIMLGCEKKEFTKQTTTSTINNAALAARSDKPNIILIMGDDIGYEVPTVDGGESYETPTMDWMAKTGMMFTQCHGSCFCAPSRWMMMTGKYNFRNYTYYGIMDRSNRTFANMLHDNGYTTGVYGKWALDGGDTSVHTFGFDQFCIWNPYKDFEGDHVNKGSHYKNPSIYDNGNFVADSLTAGKYGDDIFTDSVMNFIDSNKNRPFFAYYPMTLCHAPMSPTPDDPEYATWNNVHKNDPTFFPSMVKYTDKLIGKIITKVKQLGIAQNTVIILVAGDNGTQQDITSIFNGEVIPGGRQQHNEYGTHVPLFIYWPGKIQGGTVNNDLIDFTDFLPTIADIANVPKPTTYGPLDGVSFYPRLIGQAGTPRDWIFNHYQPFVNIPGTQLYRWVQDKTYKYYDTASTKQGGKFYNIVTDILEEHPIPNAQMTPEEKATKQKFLDVLAMEHN